jgi:lipopolysaccharide transport system ATP-binding protein
MVKSLDQVQQEPVSFDEKDEEVVLSINGVSKRFCRDLKRSLLYGVQDITTDLLDLRRERHTLRPKEFWALKDVSFQLRRGEALGLVGKNGSGKSTLLRIIAGLIKPDAGSVDIKGRVAPLIALAARFSPILTGRENVYANMSILGLSKQEIKNRFDEVVEFAEIGDAIDSPLQTYSSGMASRLGFASAIHTDPDILLIDEVLSVGDAQFGAKCHRKLQELRQKNTTFILVSHNAQTILNACDSAIYLIKGQLIASGDVRSIIQSYEEDLFLNGLPKTTGKMLLPPKAKDESLGIDILSLFFRNEQGDQVDMPTSGEPTSFCVECQSYKNFENIGLGLAIREVSSGDEITLTLSSFNDVKPLTIAPGKSEIQVWMPYLGLKPGTYTMRVFVKEGSLGTLDFVDSFMFTVESKHTIGNSVFYQPRCWKVLTSNY